MTTHLLGSDPLGDLTRAMNTKGVTEEEYALFGEVLRLGQLDYDLLHRVAIPEVVALARAVQIRGDQP